MFYRGVLKFVMLIMNNVSCSYR